MNRSVNLGSGGATVEDPPTNGRPLVAIFRDMVGHVSEIVRSEILLVTLEFREELLQRKNAAIAIAVAGLLLLYGGAFVLLGVVYALSMVWPTWLSALVVGAVIAIVGSLVLASGIKRIKSPKST